MTNKADKLLAELAELEWFSNCGCPIAEGYLGRVSSWSEATALCKARYAENVQLESRNLLTERLFSIAKERYRLWNSLVFETKSRIEQVLDQKAKQNQRGFKVSSKTRSYIYLDVSGACMELEYADLVQPRYFKCRLDWYLAGHFPCGWDGDFPEGHLVVF